jgi:hypothetical protein
MALDTVNNLELSNSEAVVSGTCTIYLYTSGPSWNTPILSVVVDGRHKGWLIEDSGYFRFVANVGPHQIEIELDHGLSSKVETVVNNTTVMCEDKTEYYLLARQDWSVWTPGPKKVELEYQPKSVGVQELKNRWRVLLKAEE